MILLNKVTWFVILSLARKVCEYCKYVSSVIDENFDPVENYSRRGTGTLRDTKRTEYRY